MGIDNRLPAAGGSEKSTNLYGGEDDIIISPSAMGADSSEKPTVRVGGFVLDPRNELHLWPSKC